MRGFYPYLGSDKVLSGQPARNLRQEKTEKQSNDVKAYNILIVSIDVYPKSAVYSMYHRLRCC